MILIVQTHSNLSCSFRFLFSLCGEFSNILLAIVSHVISSVSNFVFIVLLRNNNELISLYFWKMETYDITDC